MTALYRKLLDRAQAEIEEIDPTAAIALLALNDVLFVDVRDSAELHLSGFIPGSLHAERGMLEFYIDPSSPFHKPPLASGKRLIFYCAGGWRSALSAETARQMGLTRVAHVRGGLGAWVQAGGPVARVLRPGGAVGAVGAVGARGDEGVEAGQRSA
jgi:rhodanese-related sulfurtransferase